MKTSSLFLAACAVGTTGAFAQTDECSLATDLGTGPTTIVFDTNVCVDTNAQATTSAEQQCASLSNDVWFKYTAQTTGLASFDTCNNATFDTEIAAWRGSDCATMAPLGCNDDNSAAGCTGLTSFLTNIPVVAGETYHIQVGYWSTSATVWGAGTLTIAEFPDPCATFPDDNFEENDTCLTATTLTAGTYTGLACSLSDPDFYSISVPSGQILTVDVIDTGTEDMDIRVYDASCTLIDSPFGDSATYSNLTGSAVTVVAELFVNPGSAGAGCLNYDTTISFAPDPCFAGTDDALEPNDLCTGPRTLTPGFNSGLFASLSDPDFYEITLQANELLDFTCSNDLNADVDLRIYDSNCSLIQDFNTDALSFSNSPNTMPATVIVEVYVDPTSANSCTNYDLDVAISVDPCSVLGSDMFEDNDDCTNATPLGDGLYTGLSVFEADNDYFSVTLAAGATMTADIFFLDATADVDLYLWDPLVACDTNVAGQGTGTGALVVGFTASDDEQVVYTNTSATDMNLIVEVDMFTAGGCNTYDLQLQGVGPGGPITLGTNYCQAELNQAGLLGTMSAMGSATAAANDVTLMATDVTPNQFGIFIVSLTQGFVPLAGGTSNGNLCLGGQIGRYRFGAQIRPTGPTGEFDLTIDLTAVPQGNGSVAVVAGDTWNFQGWHREGVGSGSNFTDGLAITFN